MSLKLIKPNYCHYSLLQPSLAHQLPPGLQQPASTPSPALLHIPLHRPSFVDATSRPNYVCFLSKLPCGLKQSQIINYFGARLRIYIILFSLSKRRLRLCSEQYWQQITNSLKNAPSSQIARFRSRQLKEGKIWRQHRWLNGNHITFWKN